MEGFSTRHINCQKYLLVCILWLFLSVTVTFLIFFFVLHCSCVLFYYFLPDFQCNWFWCKCLQILYDYYCTWFSINLCNQQECTCHPSTSNQYQCIVFYLYTCHHNCNYDLFCWWQVFLFILFCVLDCNLILWCNNLCQFNSSKHMYC